MLFVKPWGPTEYKLAQKKLVKTVLYELFRHEKRLLISTNLIYNL